MRNILTTISGVIEHHIVSSYTTTEPLLLAVGMQQSISPSLKMVNEEWEDMCRECGAWEWIDGEVYGSSSEVNNDDDAQRNEFGG